MGDQTEKRFTWVLDDFSSLQDGKCYSPPFMVADCNWRLIAYPKGYMNGGYLCLYLEVADPASLPPQWRREVKFSLTVVNKGLGKSNRVLGGQCFFDATNHKDWGYKEFVSLTKLHAKDEGYLVNDKLIIIADLLVFPALVAPKDLLVSPALVAPEETVKISESLSRKEGNQASDASAGKSQEDSSCEMAQKTENASKESLDDHDISKEGSDDDDDDTSDESSDDDGSCEDDDDSSSSISLILWGKTFL